MALSALMRGEIRPGGNDTNGGFFKSGAAGTDRTQQDAPQVIIDDSTIDTSITTNVITFTLGYTPTAADVGNHVRMLTGTNVTAGVYEITAQTSTTWTVDRNVVTSGTTTNATGRMGGALASAGRALTDMTVADQKSWMKAGAYNISSTTANANGGRLSMTVSGQEIVGYDQTRGDKTGTRPVLTATTNTMTLATLANDCLLENVDFSAGAATGITGITASAQGCVVDCKMAGANTSFGMRGQDNALFIRCDVTGGTVTGFRGEGGHFIGCTADAVAARGFDLGSNDSVCDRCISINCSGGTGKGFDSSGATASALFLNCVAFGNAQAGFDSSATPALACTWVNCISYANTGTDFNGEGVARNCATDGSFGASVRQIGSITLTASPFRNSAGEDFGLNNAVGGGLLCRNAGILGAFGTAISTTGYLDLGAVQHRDIGGGNIGKSAVGRWNF